MRTCTFSEFVFIQKIMKKRVCNFFVHGLVLSVGFGIPPKCLIQLCWCGKQSQSSLKNIQSTEFHSLSILSSSSKKSSERIFFGEDNTRATIHFTNHTLQPCCMQTKSDEYGRIPIENCRTLISSTRAGNDSGFSFNFVKRMSTPLAKREC